ncbi:hypothetical protein C0431_09485 [bacterium]|nr:hypothetical protein [bacterium]
MKELTSLPASVRYQLSKAENLTAQGRPAEAQNALAEAIVTLAKTSPELCGLLLAMHAGKKRLTLTQVQEEKRTTTSERRALGIKYGTDTHRETVRKVNTRTIEFS